MEKLVIMKVSVAIAAKNGDAYMWPADADLSIKSYQKLLHDWSRTYNAAIPEKMREAANCEVDYQLRTDGDLSVGLFLNWDKKTLNQSDVDEIATLFKEDVPKAKTTVAKVQESDKYPPNMIVVENGPTSQVENVIREQGIVPSLVNAFRRAGESCKNGIKMNVDIDGINHEISYKATALPSVDESKITESVAEVIFFNDQSRQAKVRFEKGKGLELSVPDEESRVALLYAQVERKYVTLKWKRKTIWRNGHEDVVGGVITSVSEAPQMVMNL
ncbi:MAG: hypothetical protein OQK94_00885 [Gammaproteobacteria bacterium]|nr:hypothetical protein [Gammaproteobacteria bacterium]MCW8839891.1 hypothetical protein [Gammaproteobacteria bacterium]MCW8958933.1 hypothetical protein [Gammaproteobacteria bacterium]MCW8992393.1 hypothetical protein [Gammaproteobacteria bacterium]